MIHFLLGPGLFSGALATNQSPRTNLSTNKNPQTWTVWDSRIPCFKEAWFRLRLIDGSTQYSNTARAHLSPLHTPVPLAHHTSTKKNKKTIFTKICSKQIISRINFIQKFPTNYSTKLSRFFLCLLDTMCLVHPHFLTVHLQTSHSISIWLYAFL